MILILICGIVRTFGWQRGRRHRPGQRRQRRLPHPRPAGHRPAWQERRPALDDREA